MKKIYSTYRNSAMSKELEWQVPMAVFIALCKSDCAYCGSSPELRYRRTNKGRRVVVACLANGIDRIDNGRGYIPGNVVPACRLCNRSKNTQTVADYIKHCRAVVNHFTVLQPVTWEVDG